MQSAAATGLVGPDGRPLIKEVHVDPRVRRRAQAAALKRDRLIAQQQAYEAERASRSLQPMTGQYNGGFPPDRKVWMVTCRTDRGDVVAPEAYTGKGAARVYTGHLARWRRQFRRVTVREFVNKLIDATIEFEVEDKHQDKIDSFLEQWDRTHAADLWPELKDKELVT